MRFRSLGVTVLLLATLPSLFFAWRNRDFPHLGIHHDDCVYLGTAERLAAAEGYRIASLPGEPPQTRYPPVFPLYLSLTWLAGGTFPANLPGLMLLCWIPVPLFARLAWRWCGRVGFPRWRALLITVVLLVSPYTVFLGASPMTEITGCSIALGALLLAEDSSSGWKALFCGVLAGLAFLTRTALLPLTAALILTAILRGQWRRALLVALGAAPFIAGWNLWVRMQLPPDLTPAAVFYTSYARLYRENISLDILPQVVWKNLGYLIQSLGGLFVFVPESSVVRSQIARLMGIAALAGLWRLRRTRACLPYWLFAVFTFAALLTYNFPEHERLVYPLFPLLVAGLVDEGAHLTGLVKSAWPKQKAASAAIAALAISLVSSLVWFNAHAIAIGLPSLTQRERQRNLDRQMLFEWFRRNTPPETTFLAYDDTLIGLRTGRHGYGMHPPTRDLYLGRIERWVDFFGAAPEFARREKLDYLVRTPYDFERNLSDVHRQPAYQRIREAGLPVAARIGAITVYRIR